MNSFERVSFALQSKETDYVPVYPLINSTGLVHTPRLMGDFVSPIFQFAHDLLFLFNTCDMKARSYKNFPFRNRLIKSNYCSTIF
jgi:hypothetical protein